MDADLVLDGNIAKIEGDFIRTTGMDFCLDSPARRAATGGQRRALVHDFDDGLTINWNSDYPGGITLKGFQVNVESADLRLDFAARRVNDSPYRRALVHDFTDGLTLNWANDYPGGVTINGPVHIKGDVVVDGTITENTPAPSIHVESLIGRIEFLERRLVELEG